MSEMEQQSGYGQQQQSGQQQQQQQQQQMYGDAPPPQQEAGGQPPPAKEEEMSQGILILIALFIPFLAVYLKYHECNKHVWLTLLLTFLCCGIGGLIYAIMAIQDKCDK